MRNWITTAHPHRFFLLDGLGALLSAIMLGIVLVHFDPLFGMPVRVLRILALIACLFSAYYFICFYLRLKTWPAFLRGIALANLLYGAGTIILLGVYRDQMTLWGEAYFAGELLVILGLAIAEWRFAAHSVGERQG